MSIPKEDLKYLTDKQRKSLKDKKMPESQALQWIADKKKIENDLKNEAYKIIKALKDTEKQFIEYLEEDIQESLEAAFTEAMDDGKQIDYVKGRKAFLTDCTSYGYEDSVHEILISRFTGESSTDSFTGYNKESYLDVFYDYVFNDDEVIVEHLRNINYLKEGETIPENILDIVSDNYVYELRDEIFEKVLEEIMNIEMNDFIEDNGLYLESHTPLSVINENERVYGKIKEIVDDIKMITGDKTITYTTINSSNVFQINRNVEDEDQELENLESSLYYTIGNYDSAAIIIREYPMESTNSSNIKNIYGMIINGGDYRWLKEEEVFEAMNTDNKTGELLEPDTTLNYCGFYFKK